jgi:hypothetical protein
VEEDEPPAQSETVAAGESFDGFEAGDDSGTAGVSERRLDR